MDTSRDARRAPHWPPQPSGAGVLKQPLHAYGVEWKLKQHAAHTVQPVTSLPQSTVLLYVPQLRGATHLQLPMQPAAVSLPSGSARHCPTVALQLYPPAGVGGGVGGALHAARQPSAE